MEESLREWGFTAAAFALLAVAVGPVAWFIRRPTSPMVSRGAGWHGADAAAVFAVAFVARLTGELAVLLVIPAAVGFDVWRRSFWAEQVEPVPAAVAVWTGVRLWLWLTPIVFAVYAVAILIQRAFGAAPDTHPLARTPPADAVAAFRLLLMVCVAGPFFEELGFRRVLVPWAARRRWRPWLLILLAVPAAAVTAGLGDGKTPRDLLAPFGFLALLAVGLFAVQRWRRFPTRTGSAVFGTAALFALVHAGVWPSPIPLFVLGLGLGWLVARTGGLTAAVLAHGLFNAVTAVYMIAFQVRPPGE